MDIQLSSATVSTQTPITGSASSLESTAQSQRQADLVPPVKVEAQSADVEGGKIIDVKV